MIIGASASLYLIIDPAGAGGCLIYDIGIIRPIV
jgi:hypothetical protein